MTCSNVIIMCDTMAIIELIFVIMLDQNQINFRHIAIYT